MSALAPTTIWIWDLRQQPGGLDELCRRLAALPGDKGVLLKAADGASFWGHQWTRETVKRLRDTGCRVGLWTFNYGQTKAAYEAAPHTVEEELDAIGRALDAALPDQIVLNCEIEVMASPDPAGDVYRLAVGAKLLAGRSAPLGLSSVWHWGEPNPSGPSYPWPGSAPWPFDEALAGGIDFWTNQVYGRDWWSYRHYAHYLQAHGGGKPDFISLWASDAATPADMLADAQWARQQNAPGVAWWAAQQLTPERWDAIGQAAALFAPIPMPAGNDGGDAAADAALEAAYRADAARLGPQLFAGELTRDDAGAPWGGRILWCQNGVLAYRDGRVREITARLLDDASEYNLQHGTLVRY